MATHFVQSLLDGGSALDPREFLPKYAVKGNHTHFSFKGGYDEFCKYKGKWSFPDDAQVHRDLARVIEFLYERAANDEKHEFPYLIELKTQHSKFVQDLDIRAGDSFDITAFLVEQAKVLHDFYPEQELRCIVFDSSGLESLDSSGLETQPLGQPVMQT